MSPGSFAARIATPRISFGELALALAEELRPVDRAAAEAELARLAAGLTYARASAPPAQLGVLGDLLDDFRCVENLVHRRPLLLDAVLADRAGDPMLLAVLAADVARRAGFEVGIVGAGRSLFVAHRHADRPLVLDPAGLLRGRRDGEQQRVGWRCAHQVSLALLDELVDRARRCGDVAEALKAAELRLALPLDHAAKERFETDIVSLRCTLN